MNHDPEDQKKMQERATKHTIYQSRTKAKKLLIIEYMQEAKKNLAKFSNNTQIKMIMLSYDSVVFSQINKHLWYMPF